MRKKLTTRILVMISCCIFVAAGGCDDDDSPVEALPAYSLEGEWNVIIPNVEHWSETYTVFGEMKVYDCSSTEGSRALLHTESRLSYGICIDQTFRIEGECGHQIQWSYYTRNVPWEVGTYVGGIIGEANSTMDTISGTIVWYWDPYEHEVFPRPTYMFKAYKK